MDVEPRQIWAQPTSTSTVAHASCTPFLLPSNGVIIINRTYTVTMTENAYYQPACTGGADISDVVPSTIVNGNDPFYASVGAQLYAIGCMTVASYVLVVILLITPRKIFIGGRGPDGNLLGRHGMISGSYSGGSSVTGVGGRPWLQKVAALSVAISLTIATVDSLKVAKKQYELRYTDATSMTQEVIDGTEIRIVHCISSTFLWLAQVQTLIRLFPRHKEKVLIKWVGFALIVLDTVFAILDNFVSHGSETHPRLFDDAIPALAYLFEIALNLLYAAWVIFYSLSKHRFAFFHPKMRNICLLAMLSLAAIFIPVVFFIMDIASPDVAGWGEYIRWVGSAAASVVVWEWVERIEALERDERKDGILGREIFDGDEMLEVTPSQEIDWPKQSSTHDNEGGRGTGTAWRGVISPRNRPMRRTFQLGARTQHNRANENQDNPANIQPTSAPSVPPPAAVTPISRGDTTSAASTDYCVRYHTLASPTPPIAPAPMERQGYVESQNNEAGIHTTTTAPINEQHITVDYDSAAHGLLPTVSSGWKRWLPITRLFGTRRTSPPREIATAQEEEENVRDRFSVSDEDTMTEKYASPEPASKLQQVLSALHIGEGRNARSQKSLGVTVIPSRDIAQQPWSPKPNGVDSSDQMRGPPGLPITVIPTHGRRTFMWPSSQNACNELGGNGQLHYDPETAALVEVNPAFHRAAILAAEPEQQISRLSSTDAAEELTVTASEAGTIPSGQIASAQESGLGRDDTEIEAGHDTPANCMQ